jgi:hypothetical protein
VLETQREEIARLMSLVQNGKKRQEYSARFSSGREQEITSALTELRVASHMEASGFRVIHWAPAGQGLSIGEFTVEAGPREVFVEVKGPGWPGEVTNRKGRQSTQSQIQRLQQPKYIDGKGGPVGPSEAIRFAIDKAYKKFKDDRPNLLVVADNLFVSLQYGTDLHAWPALYSTSKSDPGYFTNTRYDRLSGVGVFWVSPGIFSSQNMQRQEYHMRLFLNTKAKIALPSDLQRAFQDTVVETKVPLIGRQRTPLEKYLDDPSQWKYEESGEFAPFD